jgi:predicted aspartyl protease
MKFPYRPYLVEATPSQPDLTEDYWPVIPFRVLGSMAEADYYGLVDTGADETILPRSLADEIGAVEVPGSERQLALVKHFLRVRYSSVWLQIGQGRRRYRWPAVVAITEEPLTEAILGRAGFLAYFHASFYDDRGELELIRNRRPFPESLA